MTVDGDASDTAVGVASAGVDRVTRCDVGISAVPVGALTKMLVRPGSELVQPTARVIRVNTATANEFRCLALKGLL